MSQGLGIIHTFDFNSLTYTPLCLDLTLVIIHSPSPKPIAPCNSWS